MRIALLQSAILIGALLTSQAAMAAGTPPNGVYSCYDVKMDYKMQLVITPTPFAMFGLIDATTYSDYDGHHGRYRYDPASEVLTMLDGSRQGWRYHKTNTWSFTLIDNNSGREIYTCPYEASKNPSRGPW